MQNSPHTSGTFEIGEDGYPNGIFAENLVTMLKM